MGGKVTSLDLSRDETKLAVCSRDDKIQVSVLITKLSSSGSPLKTQLWFTLGKFVNFREDPVIPQVF